MAIPYSILVGNGHLTDLFTMYNRGEGVLLNRSQGETRIGVG